MPSHLVLSLHILSRVTIVLRHATSACGARVGPGAVTAAVTLGAATTAVAADPGALAAARATHLVVIMSPGAVTGLARCGAWSAGSSSASSDAVSDDPSRPRHLAMVQILVGIRPAPAAVGH